MLAFIVGLRAEARLCHGQVFVGGGDASGAARASAGAIEAGATALVSFGLAGGLSPELPPGSVMVPGAVLSSGRWIAVDAALARALGGVSCRALLASTEIVADAVEKGRRWRETGAEAADLESGAVAETAVLAGLPFAVLRAVCDPAWRSLPPAALCAVNAQGAIGMGRVLGSVLRLPGQVPALLALARDAGLARRALVRRMAGLKQTRALTPWE